MERIVKGIWIPIEIWQDRRLSWNEKVLLMEIDSFTTKGHECYFSNEYIADLLGVADRCARKSLSHLIELGYVRVVHFDGRRRYIESAISCGADWHERATQGGTNVPETDTREYIYNLSHKSARESFKKPSVDEVAQYCADNGLDVDAQRFVDFYASKGWKVGSSPMKDWHAAARNWAARNASESNQRKAAPAKKADENESVAEHNRKVAERLLGKGFQI